MTISLEQNELDALVYMESVGVVEGGKQIGRAIARGLAEKGLIKALKNNQFLCAAKGRHIVSDWRKDPSTVKIKAKAKPVPKEPEPEPEPEPPKPKVKAKAKKDKPQTVKKAARKPAARGRKK